MTTPTIDARALWNSMPGWGIVVDLMPPEIVAARRVKVIRATAIKLLSVLMVLMIALFAFAFMRKNSAQHDLTASQDQSTQLQVELHKYADIITIQGTVAAVQTQVATLLQSDIDFPALLSSLQSALPPNVRFTQLSIAVNAPTPGSTAQAGTPSSGSTLDSGTAAHIGTVNLTGTASKLTDVSTFVDKLQALKGVVEPFPASNVSTGNNVTYSIQATLTSDLYTHRFDTQPGAKK